MSKRRRTLLADVLDAQRHVEDVTERLSRMTSDHPDFDATMAEHDHALLQRTRAEAEHAKR